VSQRPVIEGIASDRWGTWLTALAPVIDPDTGRLVAVMGMDLNARAYYQTVFVYSALPAVAAGFIILLVIVGFVIRRREEAFLQFKAELVALASHEIRTPLTGISWLAESLLAEGETFSPAERQRLQAIDERSRSVLVTVNDLLDLSAAEKRRHPAVAHEVIVRTLLEKIFAQVSLTLQERQLKTKFDRSVTPTAALCGEADRLQMVFSNLVANAVKYSRPGGTITIGYRTERGSTVVWVKDQGIGVPLADQSKIFDGGYRAENAKQTAE
jgi:signal transduction histidine kinase